MKLSAKARRKMKARAKVVCGTRQTVSQSGKQTTIVNVGRHCRPMKRRRPRCQIDERAALIGGRRFCCYIACCFV